MTKAVLQTRVVQQLAKEQCELRHDDNTAFSIDALAMSNRQGPPHGVARPPR